MLVTDIQHLACFNLRAVGITPQNIFDITVSFIFVLWRVEIPAFLFKINCIFAREMCIYFLSNE